MSVIINKASDPQYGFLIGQINEVEFLPKYVPAFIILNLSVLLEIVMILLWNKEDFIMCDGPQDTQIEYPADQSVSQKYLQQTGATSRRDESLVMGGDSRGDLEEEGTAIKRIGAGIISSSPSNDVERSSHHSLPIEGTPVSLLRKKNPQLKLFKLIVRIDWRIVKYFILFTVFGVIMAPCNFIFLSYKQNCGPAGQKCNFSKLSGTVLVSQAASETAFFFVMPWILKRVSKSVCLAVAFVILAIRFHVYAQFYYSDKIPPYSALLLECGHGIPYSIVVTIIAEVSLSAANQSRFFIPELRKFGYLSDIDNSTPAQIRSEENSIKMALRATMQALNSSLFEGLGFGLGNLLAGLSLDANKYVHESIQLTDYSATWFIFATSAVVCLIFHQILEVTKSRLSDSFKPREGTRIFELMKLPQPARRSKRKQDSNKSELKLLENLHESAQPVTSGLGLGV